jgi:hypothetical protein
MDIVRKRAVKGGQGNAVAGAIDAVARAGSWQYGADALYEDYEAEKKEEDLKFGTPNEVVPSEEQYHDPSGINATATVRNK